MNNLPPCQETICAFLVEVLNPAFLSVSLVFPYHRAKFGETEELCVLFLLEMLSNSVVDIFSGFNEEVILIITIL